MTEEWENVVWFGPETGNKDQMLNHCVFRVSDVNMFGHGCICMLLLEPDWYWIFGADADTDISE